MRRPTKKRTLQLNAINHRMLALVYDRGRPTAPFAPALEHPDSFTPKITWPNHFNRRQHVLLAQLHSGHCSKLAAYATVIGSVADPICPRCREEPHDLPHWLQRCPALQVRRINCFDAFDPPLSVLTTQTDNARLYAESLSAQLA